MKNLIKTKIRENLNSINFNIKEVDEDNIEVNAILNGEKIGSLHIQLLFDIYNYEFDDVFDEDEFDKLYPDPEIVKIEYLEVDDDYKGMGIAKKLMDKGMSLMKQKGHKQFYLNASPMGFNGLSVVDLVEFYKKYGFKVLLNQGGNVLMGITNELNETHIVIKKLIRENI